MGHTGQDGDRHRLYRPRADPGTSYSYTVKAVDAAGNRSPASKTATATTAAGGNVITLAPTNDATSIP